MQVLSGAVPGVVIVAITQGGDTARLTASVVFFVIAASAYAFFHFRASAVQLAPFVYSLIGASAAGVILDLPIPVLARLATLVLAAGGLYLASP